VGTKTIVRHAVVSQPHPGRYIYCLPLLVVSIHQAHFSYSSSSNSQIQTLLSSDLSPQKATAYPYIMAQAPTFIDLRSMPTRLSFCKKCSGQYCTMDNLSHYPVRLPKGDVCCYSCAVVLLDKLSDRREDRGLQVRVLRARESIDKQVECCGKALAMEEQRWVLAQIPAARRAQGLRGEV